MRRGPCADMADVIADQAVEIARLQRELEEARGGYPEAVYEDDWPVREPQPVDTTPRIVRELRERT